MILISGAIYVLNIFMRRLLTLIMLILLGTKIHAQIVNIEQKRLQKDSIGWTGDVHLNFAIQRTTKNLLNIQSGGHVSHHFKNSQLLLLGELGLVRGEGEKFSNNGFGHLRYTIDKSKWLSYELFTQLQYNTLTKINSRWLTGGGIRLHLTQFENAPVTWGLLYMYENEEVIDPSELNNHHRMSTYFSFEMKPQSSVSFLSTTYVQPRIDQWSDYRILNENKFNLSITENLHFSIRFQLTYDSQPPVEVPSLTYDLSNGLKYRF